MYTEYLYRKLFHVARHEDYLDEPGDVIQWMTRIDSLVRAQESKQAKDATNKKG